MEQKTKLFSSQVPSESVVGEFEERQRVDEYNAETDLSITTQPAKVFRTSSKPMFYDYGRSNTKLRRP